MGRVPVFSGWNVTTISSLILTFAFLPLSPAVNAQNITQTIIEQTKNIPECYLGTQAMILEISPPNMRLCVEVIYESQDRVVLIGDFIKDGVYNLGIWKVVDALESGGWSVENTFFIGQGSQGNPHKYVISLTK